MTVELVVQGASRETAQTVFNALDAYKARLHASIQRTRRNLNKLEYVEWAGEAKSLEGLEAELRVLENVCFAG